MHLLDILDAPTCVATGVAAGGAVAVGLRRVRADVGDRLVPLMGVMSACVFAAQTVKFPVLPGASGHLVGGVLAAAVLGPWAGLLAMSVVVIAQCLLFYDGGLTVLGANLLNMAVAGPLVGYLAYVAVRRLAPGRSGCVAGAAVGAWLSVVVSAALAGSELAYSGVAPLAVVLPALVGVHALIGIGEALITAMTVSFLLRVRPELLYVPSDTSLAAKHWRPITAAGFLAALLTAFCASPLASAAPDGLEYVALQLGFDRPPRAPALSAPLPQYQVPGLSIAWLATSLAAAAGTAAASAIAWAVARSVRLRRSA